MDTETALNLLDLPDLCLEKIFSYLTYDEIAKKRIVSEHPSDDDMIE